ncbi:hypothetical protein BN59_03257 [Legionella massiliensis]|uniref:Uncharacterized protein n=1 Tax=Legionella massiliensis TaxID=1034943 RepID=A0A078L150_9GAMM|nr:hypothetical protein [Legionella massiliensis]CDZ78942.1 hypothetical protein BN59_03257 [Legionella massiliensis]CEE14680.1 hypothetical protein BN1094_03257 [Legionella massiliensis]
MDWLNRWAFMVPLTKDGEICGPQDIAENAELVVFDQDAIKVDYVLQLRKTLPPQKPNIIGDNINSFFKNARPDAARIASMQYSLPQAELGNSLYMPLQVKPKIETGFTLSNQERVEVGGDEQGNLTVIHPKSGESKTWKAHNGAICSLKFIDDRIVSFSKQDGMKQWDCPVGLNQNVYTLM